MTTILQKLINALRNELQQYGEMLALLDHQQEISGLNGADDILHFISTVTAQSAIIQASRQARESLQQQLAHTLDQPANSTFPHLISFLPEQYRPLVTALVQENIELLSQVERRAQEKQRLLRRCLEMMDRFIGTLSPQDSREQENQDHTEFITGPPGDSFYEVIA